MAKARLAIRVSYSTSLLIEEKPNQSTHWISPPSGLTRTKPTPKPLAFEAPSTFRTHYFFRSSSIKSSSGFPSGIVHSVIKSVSTYAFMKVLERNAQSNSKPFFSNYPAIVGLLVEVDL